MFLDKLSQNITSFRQNIILGIFLFLIVVSSFFSGEWNNWIVAIFLILVFPLAFYAVLLWRDRVPDGPAKLNLRTPSLYLSVFLGVGFVTAFFSVMKYGSWHYWILLVAYAVIFWVATTVFKNFSHVRLITLVVFFTGVLASLINLFLFLKDPATRAGGALLNANALGSYFLFSLPLGIVLTLDEPRKKFKYLFAAATIIILISFFLTFSYTGWVSFVIPLLLIGGLYKKQLFTKKNALIAVIVIVGLLLIAVGIRYSSTKDLKQAIALHRTISGQGFSYSFQQRWNFIQSTAQMFLDRPWGGWGLATYQQVYPQYALTLLEQPRYAHNYYLQTAAETGVIGFVALVGFVVTVLVASYHTIKRHLADSVKRPYVLGLGLGVLGSAIHSLFDFGWQFPAVFLLFWMSGGFLLGQRVAGLAPQTVGQQPPRKLTARAGAIAVIVFSLALLVRGVTLFLSQSYFERAEPKKLDGNLDAALPLYEQAVRFDPAPDKMRDYAIALFEQGAQKKDEREADYRRAEELFLIIVSWNPSDYFTYHQAGKMYFMRKENARAEAEYKKAIQHDPLFHPDFQYDLAFLYYTQQKYDQVDETIQPVLDRYAGISESSNPRLSTQLAFLNLLLGKSDADQGDMERARYHFLEALNREPDLDLAKNELEQLAQ